VHWKKLDFRGLVCTGGVGGDDPRLARSFLEENRPLSDGLKGVL